MDNWVHVLNMLAIFLIYIFYIAFNVKFMDVKEKSGTFRELYKIRDKLSIDDFYKTEILEIENESIVESLLIELNEKEYIGTWSQINKTADYNGIMFANLTQNFKNKKGEIIVKFTVSSTFSNTKINIDFTIKDGKYKENWVNLVQEFQYSPKNYINDLEFQFNYGSSLSQRPNAIMRVRNKPFSHFMKYNLIRLMEVFGSNAYYVEFGFFGILQDGIKGSLSYPEIGFDINFDGHENHSWGYNQKVGNFTILLTFIGMMQLYHTLTLIRDSLLGRMNPKSVNYHIYFSYLLLSSVLT